MAKFTKFVIVLIWGIVLTSCDRDDGSLYDYVYKIEFKGNPIEIMSSTQAFSSYDRVGLNYFNIIKIKEDLFYMYYLAFGEDTDGTDLSQRMLFAYSTDLFHWSKTIPQKDNNLILENLADASVSYNPELDWPFRLVCRKMVDRVNHLAMYRSKNGYEFEFCKYLLDGKYDTQSACIDGWEGYRLYTRMWNDEHTDRMIGVAKFDREDNCIDSLKSIGLHYVYNPACSKVDEKYVMLMPSYMNNLEKDGSDKMKVLTYLMDNNGVFPVETNFNQIENYDQIYISPGLVEWQGDKYISYQVKNQTHDKEALPETTYKLLKVVFKKEWVNSQLNYIEP